ncbi:hypothetical protein GOQ27_05765 [Clostridium sp. D2Q-11]|uniref:YesK-like protein n=1 Tax=Anaeromonas frigoriresistens TaxID=2683708 RepID=A0A942USV8_9FIRM|nr:YesK family protein [Anaeromonas frigoriresistens]MBS4537958.1 hypothetical protein [Anaeromonas frigoriresistens]
MNTFLLEGWTFIFIVGIIFAVGSFIISFKVSRRVLFSISIILSLLCVGLFIYSLVGIRRWEGLILGLVSISIFLGIWIGTIGGVIIRKLIHIKNR